MRDDVQSEGLALEALEQSGWHIWLTAKREGVLHGAKTPTELHRLVTRQHATKGKQ